MAKEVRPPFIPDIQRDDTKYFDEEAIALPAVLDSHVKGDPPAGGGGKKKGGKEKEKAKDAATAAGKGKGGEVVKGTGDMGPGKKGKQKGKGKKDEVIDEDALLNAALAANNPSYFAKVEKHEKQKKTTTKQKDPNVPLNREETKQNDGNDDIGGADDHPRSSSRTLEQQPFYGFSFPYTTPITPNSPSQQSHHNDYPDARRDMQEEEELRENDDDGGGCRRARTTSLTSSFDEVVDVDGPREGLVFGVPE